MNNRDNYKCQISAQLSRMHSPKHKRNSSL